MVRNTLGVVLWAQGDLEGARAQLERSLAVSEAALGPDHLDVAVGHNNLGSVLWAQGDLEGARVKLERSLAVTEAALGPSHPEVAIRLNNLGGVLQALGDLEGARAQAERALAIGEAALGPDHPHVANLRRILGIGPAGPSLVLQPHLLFASLVVWASRSGLMASAPA
jgi:Tfp pilus assembly protein PilF